MVAPRIEAGVAQRLAAGLAVGANPDAFYVRGALHPSPHPPARPLRHTVLPPGLPAPACPLRPPGPLPPTCRCPSCCPMVTGCPRKQW